MTPRSAGTDVRETVTRSPLSMLLGTSPPWHSLTFCVSSPSHSAGDICWEQ
ncbi:hypothetical protein MC885_005240 [Smutsia gigantea]|nr:hypothetical protein MC885_005240 [Smutsia gigantea]